MSQDPLCLTWPHCLCVGLPILLWAEGWGFQSARSCLLSPSPQRRVQQAYQGGPMGSLCAPSLHRALGSGWKAAFRRKKVKAEPLCQPQKPGLRPPAFLGISALLPTPWALSPVLLPLHNPPPGGICICFSSSQCSQLGSSEGRLRP